MAEDALTQKLKSTFGFPGFRGLQLPVIQSVLKGRSTLAVLPTGASCSFKTGNH
jgi:ATP-dependent DNA helicase RecQ